MALYKNFVNLATKFTEFLTENEILSYMSFLNYMVLYSLSKKLTLASE